MGWVEELTPIQNNANPQGSYLPFTVPGELINITKGNALLSFVFRMDRKFKCSSADGTEVRTRKIVNNPKGSGAYWVEAIKERMGPYYHSSSLAKTGDYDMVRLESSAPSVYVYYVGVRPVGKYLEVVEIYHPSLAHEKRYHQNIQSSLSKGSKESWYL